MYTLVMYLRLVIVLLPFTHNNMYMDVCVYEYNIIHYKWGGGG